MWLPSNHKSTLVFIRVLAGLSPKSLGGRSRTYFHWERSTLCFWCATIPRKNLGLSIFLVTEWRLRYSFVFTRSTKSLPVSRISSTYTTRIIKLDLVCGTNTDWSEWKRWKSMSEIVMLNFSNHACGLCLSQYIVFLRWHTLFSP